MDAPHKKDRLGNPSATPRPLMVGSRTGAGSTKDVKLPLLAFSGIAPIMPPRRLGTASSRLPASTLAGGSWSMAAGATIGRTAVGACTWPDEPASGSPPRPAWQSSTTEDRLPPFKTLHASPESPLPGAHEGHVRADDKKRARSWEPRDSATGRVRGWETTAAGPWAEEDKKRRRQWGDGDGEDAIAYGRPTALRPDRKWDGCSAAGTTVATQVASVDSGAVSAGAATAAAAAATPSSPPTVGQRMKYWSTVLAGSASCAELAGSPPNRSSGARGGAPKSIDEALTPASISDGEEDGGDEMDKAGRQAGKGAFGLKARILDRSSELAGVVDVVTGRDRGGGVGDGGGVGSSTRPLLPGVGAVLGVGCEAGGGGGDGLSPMASSAASTGGCSTLSSGKSADRRRYGGTPRSPLSLYGPPRHGSGAYAGGTGGHASRGGPGGYGPDSGATGGGVLRPPPPPLSPRSSAACRCRGRPVPHLSPVPTRTRRSAPTRVLCAPLPSRGGTSCSSTTWLSMRSGVLLRAPCVGAHFRMRARAANMCGRCTRRSSRFRATSATCGLVSEGTCPSTASGCMVVAEVDGEVAIEAEIGVPRSCGTGALRRCHCACCCFCAYVDPVVGLWSFSTDRLGARIKRPSALAALPCCVVECQCVRLHSTIVGF